MRATNQQYLTAMHETNGRPLLHTVVFESARGPQHKIEQGNELVRTVRDLGSVAGVTEVRAAHHSINSANILEEITLKNNDALQALRSDPVHAEVVKIAREHTNWTVVDRLYVPEAYAEELALVSEAYKHGSAPLSQNTIITFKDTASDSDIATARKQHHNLLGNASTYTVHPSEYATSLDTRKGIVDIARTTWVSEEAMRGIAESSTYHELHHDLGDIATITTVTYHPDSPE